jgi:ribonuclease HI
VTELGGGDRETTNNRMELTAAIRALVRVQDLPGKVDLHTDSVYVIKGITQWIWGWRKREWKTAEGGDVSNVELWKTLFSVVMRRGKEGPVGWHYVRGHAGIPGNERCDEIAVAFSKGRRPSLYEGPLLGYGVAIHDVPDDTSVPESANQPRAAKVAAYSYLSLVNGVARRHRSWPECEAQVKGRSGAKFKKAVSAADEASILQAWGVRPEALK